MTYAIVRADGSVRAVSADDASPIGERALPLNGVVPGAPLSWTDIIPDDATSVTAQYDLSDLLVVRHAERRATADRLLSPTDYAIVRAADPTSLAPVPAGVLAYRQSVRNASLSIADWIDDADRTIDDLRTMAGSPAWPLMS